MLLQWGYYLMASPTSFFDRSLKRLLTFQMSLTASPTKAAGLLTRAIPVFAMMVTLAGCDTVEVVKTGLMGTDSQSYYKVGTPYKIDGKWYYPKEEPDYEEIGMASWYGDEFDGKVTANGDVFDKYEISAAHRTLPLPSMVKVTNLENNKSMHVRLNDRGPYAKNRIIDLSEAAAKKLGMYRKGTAKVKVEYDAAATEQMFAQADHKHYRRGYLNRPKPARTAEVKFAKKGRELLYIQAGAYSIYANARRNALSLEPYGKVHIEEVNAPERKFYRVRVGPVGLEDAADQLLEQVRMIGYQDAIIVKDYI